MKHILILSAFPHEQAYYKKHLAHIERKKVGYITVDIYDFNGATIYLATTGIGTINASLVLATLAAKIKLDAVFFSGTSGGIDQRLNIGDAVIASETFDADLFSIHDTLTDTPFEEALTNPNTKQKELQFFNASQALCSHINKDKWAFNILEGTVATSNHFPSPAALFKVIKAQNALAIDMESTAIYQFSWATGLPSLVIRSVSNLLDSDGHDDNVDNSDIASSDHSAMVVLDCIGLIM